MTVTAQHTSMLRQQGRNETPRQAFITDLRQFITDQHSQGKGVLLAGDYNEELDITYDGIAKLCSDFHHINLMFHLTGQDDFATYARSPKCIDYILCDAWVSDASLQGCYEPFQYRLKGDHHAMVVDFDTLLLFGNPTSTLATPAQQEFSSKDAGSNLKYMQHKHQYLTKHHFDSRLPYLQETWDPALAEQLDRDFQRASSSAAKSIRHKPHAPYVRKLQNYAKRRMSSNRSYHSIALVLIFPLVLPTKSETATTSSSLQLSRNANNDVVTPNKKSASSRKTPSHFESRNKHNSVEKPSNMGTMKLPKPSNTT